MSSVNVTLRRRRGIKGRVRAEYRRTKHLAGPGTLALERDPSSAEAGCT
jgi:hypothetical protein